MLVGLGPGASERACRRRGVRIIRRARDAVSWFVCNLDCDFVEREVLMLWFHRFAVRGAWLSG